MAEPAAPDPETREHLLATLAELVARGGAAPLLTAPVAPGPRAFPEPWAKTAGGVQILAQRLLWHAGIERAVTIDDHSAGAPPTERKPATRVELVAVHRDRVELVLGFVGDDDVVGTLAHEVGTIHAALHRPDDVDPYRSAERPVIEIDPELDPERGSIATVYLGLGVLAANAAYQQYSRAGRFNGGYVPLEYDVLRAGALPMSALAFLVAVQAVVRGDDVPPGGLRPPQRDEVASWMKALAGQAGALRDRLGIAQGAQGMPRPTIDEVFALPVHDAPEPERVAFRWQTHRGVGMIAGAIAGVGVAFALARGVAPIVALGGATIGHVLGRRVRAPRCSACASIVRGDAKSCPRCGAMLRGEIAHLGERLEAEERLEDRASAD